MTSSRGSPRGFFSHISQATQHQKPKGFHIYCSNNSERTHRHKARRKKKKVVDDGRRWRRTRSKIHQHTQQVCTTQQTWIVHQIRCFSCKVWLPRKDNDDDSGLPDPKKIVESTLASKDPTNSLVEEVLVAQLAGSFAFNLNLPSSDHDYFGVFLTKIDNVLGTLAPPKRNYYVLYTNGTNSVGN